MGLAPPTGWPRPHRGPPRPSPHAHRRRSGWPQTCVKPSLMRRCLKVRANCSSSSRSLGSSGWEGGSKHLGGCGCERCGSGSVGRVTAWWGGQMGGMQDEGPGWGSAMAAQSRFSVCHPLCLPAFPQVPSWPRTGLSLPRVTARGLAAGTLQIPSPPANSHKEQAGSRAAGSFARAGGHDCISSPTGSRGPALLGTAGELRVPLCRMEPSPLLCLSHACWENLVKKWYFPKH